MSCACVYKLRVHVDANVEGDVHVHVFVHV